jgi:MscS family membrane protein
MKKKVAALSALLLLCSLAGIVAAETAPRPVSSEQPVLPVAEEPADAGSPRATMATYIGLCRTGNFAEAGKFLDTPKARAGQGPLLARRLKAVLDHYSWIDLDAISPAESGKLDDGLPANLEQIAQIRGSSGRLESVRLSRRYSSGDGPSWVFSRSTVEHIDAWYDKIELRWALDRLPLWSLRPGPKEILIWQWIVLLPLLAISWLLGRLLSRLSRHAFAKFAARTKNTWDDVLVGRLGGPITMVWVLGLLYAAIPLLGLYQPAKDFLLGLIRGGFYFCGFWVVSRLIEVWGNVVGSSTWALEHLTARSLVPVAVQLGKIIVLVIAVVALVSAMGYPAASLIAGLGVGGLAIALAAQKTVENLFGAFTLGFDQPFRVGDFVKIEDFLGTVESIGLRSTKIRTLDRTVISIANGKLSEMRIESYTARDRIRLACILGLVYSTTADQMKQVLSGLEQVLRAHPKIWPDTLVVRFKEFGDSALEIEVMAWFQTTDFGEFQQIREDILLGFMQVVEEAKSSFAFPTRTVHIVQTPS